MNLSVLPARTAGAAENMAVDFLLLQRWPGPVVPRFRHYEWRGPAFTFGYSQKIAFIRSQLPTGGADPPGTLDVLSGPNAVRPSVSGRSAPPFDPVRIDLCRRPTGGGIVNHREDWTYSLVIPRGHPLEETRATESYRIIHECIAAALREQGVKAQLATAPTPLAGAEALPGICFQKAEIHDVIGAGGVKIAGAAQKRSKLGLLFQGSISRPAAGARVDWDRFGEEFPVLVAKELGGEAQLTGWPEFNEEEVEALIEQYSSPEWVEAR